MFQTVTLDNVAFCIFIATMIIGIAAIISAKYKANMPWIVYGNIIVQAMATVESLQSQLKIHLVFMVVFLLAGMPLCFALYTFSVMFNTVLFALLYKDVFGIRTRMQRKALISVGGLYEFFGA